VPDGWAGGEGEVLQQALGDAAELDVVVEVLFGIQLRRGDDTDQAD